MEQSRILVVAVGHRLTPLFYQGTGVEACVTHLPKLCRLQKCGCGRMRKSSGSDLSTYLL